MTFELFTETIKNEISMKAGEGYSVTVREVDKNNGICLKGLMITGESSNVAPTIYLDEFYDAFIGGMSIDGIVEQIWAIYKAEVPKSNLDMSFFRSFEQVKDHICYRLVNLEQNKRLLEQIPHIDFLDLAICFYYSFHTEEIGEASILIRNSHMEMWGITTSDLLRCASENTPKLFEEESYSMISALKGFLEEKEEWDEEQINKTEMELNSLPMRILSNKSRIYGASCMLYPNVLDKLGEEFDCNFYILPSSIHEGATRFVA